MERILFDAGRRGEDPLPLLAIASGMRAKRVRHSTVRACVDELIRQGHAVDIPTRGIAWACYPYP